MRKLSQISTDFQNINDVWISGISGISVGKSENAAENTAFVFSLTESCMLNGINQETYLERLFKCIVSKETYDKRKLLRVISKYRLNLENHFLRNPYNRLKNSQEMWCGGK